MKIKTGQLVAITSGEYSDYCLRDHMIARKDFDSDEEIIRFKESGPYLESLEGDSKGEATAYGSDERFIAWMIREGMMEPLENGTIVELWIGAYGKIDG